MNHQSSTLGSLLIIISIALSSVSAFAQLVIESGPFGIQKSNRDGKTEISAPAGFSDQVIVQGNGSITSGIQTNSQVRGVVPSRRQLPAAQVTNQQRVAHVVDVRKIQKIAKLERELGVIKTNREAWIAFDSDMLFSANGTSLKKSGQTYLNKVIMYLSLCGCTGITVDYGYIPGRDSTEKGQSCSESVVGFLMEKTGMSVGNFTIPEPQPLQYVTEASRMRKKSVVNIRIQRLQQR